MDRYAFFKNIFAIFFLVVPFLFLNYLFISDPTFEKILLIFLSIPFASVYYCLLKGKMSFKRLCRLTFLCVISPLVLYTILPIGYGLANMSKKYSFYGDVVLFLVFFIVLVYYIYILVAPFKNKWWPKN